MHGDHPIIVLCPSSVRETFDITIRAFNLAEKYRTPVILMMDEVIAHMREKVELPNDNEIEIINRKKPEIGLEKYNPYEVKEGELVPPMAAFGDGYRFHVTGLVHDQSGFPKTNPEIAENLIKRLNDKITNNVDDIVTYEEYKLDDAEIAIVAYGGTARSVKSAVNAARNENIKVGMFRPITIWPFPQKQVEELAKKVKKIIVVEMNLGQYYLEVDRIAGKYTEVYKYGRVNGELITPEEILSKIKEV